MKARIRLLGAASLAIAAGVAAQSQLRPLEPTFDPAPLTAPPPIGTGRGTGTGIDRPNLNSAPLPAIASPDAAPAVPRIDSLPAPAVSNSGSVNQAPMRVIGSENPTRDAELAALRKAALQAPPGERNSRSQASASWVLGLVELHGIGLPANQADAASWFERAYRLGEPSAAAGLAWCEIEGCRGPPNPATAQLWISRLRPSNPGRAQLLQWLLASKLAPLQLGASGAGAQAQSTSSTDVRLLLLNAARAGDAQARIELGFESAAANRSAEALDYFLSAGVRSPAAADNASLLVAQRAPASAGRTSSLADKTFAQGQKNHRGEGQPANFTEAIRLYRLAQNQGSPEARKMLALIFSRPAADGQIDIAWMQQLAYANVSGDSPTLGGSTNRPGLRRDPTPLYDLLPPNWRK